MASGGKSRFARRLGEILNLGIWRTDASRSDGADFGGTDKRWYSAEPCHPFLAVAQAKQCDNGPEFAGRMLDQWAYLNGIEFSRPGKPTDNASCEAFNGRVRAECLNASWFLSMTDAVDRLEEWRCHYNNDRPHTSLGNLTPNEFARQTQTAREIA